VLGTAGNLSIALSLPFTVQLAATSFAFFADFLEGFFSPSREASAGEADNCPPSATPFDPPAGLDGFDDENRRWCVR
jgi:hypothetical protein